MPVPVIDDGDDFDDLFVTGDEVAPFVSEVVDWVIDRVNAMVGEEWTTPVDPIPAAVKTVAFEVAVRALSNPKGADSRTRSTDGTAVTDRFSSSRRDIERRIYFTGRDLRVLRGGTKRRRYGTVMVGVR